MQSAAVIRFLMKRREGLPSIHCEVYNGKPVINFKADKAILYLTSLLSRLR